MATVRSQCQCRVFMLGLVLVLCHGIVFNGKNAAVPQRRLSSWTLDSRHPAQARPPAAAPAPLAHLCNPWWPHHVYVLPTRGLESHNSQPSFPTPQSSCHDPACPLCSAHFSWSFNRTVLVFVFVGGRRQLLHGTLPVPSLSLLSVCSGARHSKFLGVLPKLLLALALFVCCSFVVFCSL